MKDIKSCRENVKPCIYTFSKYILFYMCIFCNLGLHKVTENLLLHEVTFFFL